MNNSSFRRARVKLARERQRNIYLGRTRHGEKDEGWSKRGRERAGARAKPFVSRDARNWSLRLQLPTPSPSPSFHSLSLSLSSSALLLVSDTVYPTAAAPGRYIARPGHPSNIIVSRILLPPISDGSLALLRGVVSRLTTVRLNKWPGYSEKSKETVLRRTLTHNCLGIGRKYPMVQ